MPDPVPAPESTQRPVSHSSRLRFRDYMIRRKKAGADERVNLMGAAAAKQDGAGRADAGGSDEKPERKGKKKRLKRSFWTLLRAFWKLLRGRHHTVYFGVATVTCSTLLALIPPAATKVTLDFVLSPTPRPEALRNWLHAPAWVPIPETPRGQLFAVCGVLVAVSLVSVCIGISGRYQMTRLTKLLQVRVRKMVFDHAVRLPLHRVHQIKSGGVASILREDAGGAAELLFSLLYNPWKAIVQLVGTLVILAVVDWKLLLGAIAVIPAAYFSQKTWISRIRPIFSDIRNTRTQIDAHAAEAFGGMRVVRGFNRQRGESARFIRGNDLMARQELLAWWWSRILEIIWLIMLPVASAAVLLYGGTRVLAGTLTLGDLMMFSFYLLMLLGPLESLTNSATAIQNQLAGFDRVLDLTSEPVELTGRAEGAKAEESPERPAATGPESLHSRNGTSARPAVQSRSGTELLPAANLSFENVSFSYPNHSERVLRNITLDVPAGTTVALVGRSGAGKTTLCNLVARFYDPTEGRIRFDGRDLRDIPVDEYRRGLGIVEQDVFLFDGTVGENIGYARRHATPAQIRDAAVAAHADEFIQRLEHGYDTIIGERGVRLSGGQKQRIAIARAILADPRILILDEATSNLDSESEALIQVSLSSLMRGRTALVIAHRLSTIRGADLIVVLEHGRIIEQGSHEALLAAGGRYAEMLELQLHPERAAERRQPAGS
ncbi:MAG: ABC transporter ATP-binding protein [Phycisphaerales bacterium]